MEGNLVGQSAKYLNQLSNWNPILCGVKTHLRIRNLNINATFLSPPWN